MINDYELIKNPDILLKKKFVIWGAGQRGKEMAEKILKRTNDLEFVDSDMSKRLPGGILECRFTPLKGWENILLIMLRL